MWSSSWTLFLNPEHSRADRPLESGFADWFRAFEPDYHFDIEEAQDLGDAVFLFATCYGHGRTSGVEVQGQTGFLYRLRGGKIVRVELYPSRADALEAAGLRE
jgi:ketosteroid isomerase-like protein